MIFKTLLIHGIIKNQIAQPLKLLYTASYMHFHNLTRVKSPVYKEVQTARNFHASSKVNDLMEFFDDPKNWGESEVRSGREWKIDELRIKSNSDLHKLWFVLYKEKNMLLTMEHAAKKEAELFPNPERIDRVEISMENLEAVVRERNEAYYMLETGKTGERPHGFKEDPFGRFENVPLEEHLIPMKENKKFLEEDLFPTIETVNPTLPEFLLKLKEKEYLMKRYQRKIQRRHIKKLFVNFPNLDMEALQAEYPDIDVYQVKQYLQDTDQI